MLQNFLSNLFEELKLGDVPSLDKEASCHFKISDLDIELKQLSLVGVYFCSNLEPLPQKNQENFLLSLMEANFIGQGTGGATIGLKEDESCLVLSSIFPYEMEYQIFRENLETFVNFVAYWKKQIVQHDLKM